jgi:N-acyl homoserine lactone hydrolase
MDAMPSKSSFRVANYDIDILVQGFPGKSVCHGGLGWSTIALLRGEGRVVLFDTGSFSQRRLLVDGLAERNLRTTDVTDVILSHAHWDHSINWIMFPRANIWIGAAEMEWAVNEPVGSSALPELYVRELHRSPQLQMLTEGQECVPGIRAYLAPGHTPGHVIYVLEGPDRDLVFTGDSAKNRIELITREADMTYDPAITRATIERIWGFWTRRPGSIVMPGHDMPMVLEGGEPRYLGRREAAISCWFGDTLDETTLFQLLPTK